MFNIIYLQRFLLLSAFILHSAASGDEKESTALFLMKHHFYLHIYMKRMVAENKEMFTFDLSDNTIAQKELTRNYLTCDDMQNIIQKMSAQHGLQTWWSHLTEEKKKEQHRLQTWWKEIKEDTAKEKDQHRLQTSRITEEQAKEQHGLQTSRITEEQAKEQHGLQTSWSHLTEDKKKEERAKVSRLSHILLLQKLRRLAKVLRDTICCCQ